MRPIRAWLALALALPAASARGDWWSENVEIHGFATTSVYGRWPDFSGSNSFRLSSWRTELDVETDVKVFSDPDWQVAFFGVLRPSYDSVFWLEEDIWGDSAIGASPSPQPPENQVLYDPVGFGADIAPIAIEGNPFVRHGKCVRGEFCLGNGDVGSLFSNQREPALIIDDIVFYGVTTAPWVPRGKAGKVGGNATGETYLSYLALDLGPNSAREVAGRARLTDALTPIVGPGPAAALASAAVTLGTTGLQASLLTQASSPLSTPLNAYAGALGDPDSFEQAPFDVNRQEEKLAFDCLDNAHPWCFVREAYFQVDHEDTSLRVGRQQIVWGKTDAFRLQDIVNPIDIGYHNVFPDLEERRIPSLSLDVIQSFQDVGPVEDVSLEFVWVFDRFLPLQFGQCGEPYAYTLACQGRTDAAAHQLLNIALARVEEVPWRFTNTEPGMRFEFRTPKPSISFSLSWFYGFQDLPVAEFVNRYSAANPNPAAMLFLQGQGLGAVVETFTGQPLGSTPWSTGFDPYDTSPGSDLQAANALLIEAWRRVFDAGFPAPPAPFAGVNCKGLTGDALSTCAETFLPLALPWTASEVVLRYPRIWTLGGSADYQIGEWDTVLRVEAAYDFDRAINNTARLDGSDHSDVFMAAVGIDRPTYFRFLNPDRTALLSFQTFVEHVMDYDDGNGAGDGMVVYENQFITTFLHEHYWRNDSLVLRNFLAYDWNADAFILGPSFKWVINQNLSARIGLNFLLGDTDRDHNLRHLCPGSGGALDCIGDPTTWNAGQWQALNRGLERRSQSPWWSRQGFADRFQDRRDEIWIGVTYQF
jgi:hypothetical protein